MVLFVVAFSALIMRRCWHAALATEFHEINYFFPCIIRPIHLYCSFWNFNEKARLISRPFSIEGSRTSKAASAEGTTHGLTK